METPRHWRMRKQRYALEGEVCSHCGAKVFPTAPGLSSLWTWFGDCGRTSTDDSKIRNGNC